MEADTSQTEETKTPIERDEDSPVFDIKYIKEERKDEEEEEYKNEEEDFENEEDEENPESAQLDKEKNPTSTGSSKGSKSAYQCNICDKKYDYKCKLTRHMRIHTGERPYKCKLCEKSFYEKSHLQLHDITHTGIKPYPCNYCKSAFSRLWDRNSHMFKYHKELKPHVCKNCGKSYRKATDLSEHMNIHRVAITHDCSECGKTFSVLSELNKHKRSHFEWKPFECPLCEQEFHVKSELQSHILSVHNPNVETETKTDDCYTNPIETTKVKVEIEEEEANTGEMEDLNDKFEEIEEQEHLNKSIDEEINDGEIENITQDQNDKDKEENKEEPEQNATPEDKFIFECPMCDKRFDFKSKLKRHVQTHTGYKPYKCTHCDKSYYDRSHLKIHIQLHVDDRPHACEYCGKTYARIWSLNEHLLTHKDEPHVCTHCGDSFARAGELKKHMRIHPVEKNLGCDQCGESFTEQAKFTRHKRKHSDVRPYACSLCDKRFKLKSHVKNHIHTMHSKKPEDFVLGVKNIKSEPVDVNVELEQGNNKEETLPEVKNIKKELNDVEQLVIDVNPGASYEDRFIYVCEFCNKRFDYNSKLLRHLRTHTGDRPYKCPHCEKGYYEKSHLKLHIRTHTGEKPHSCKYCAKSYARVWDLNAHLLTHSGVKPHTCKTCGKSFRRVCELQDHVLTHRVMVSHGCTHCAISFPTLSELNRHMHEHSGVPLFSCPLCDKGFQSKNEVKDHVVNMHAQNQDDELLNEEFIYKVKDVDKKETVELDEGQNFGVNTGEMDYIKQESDDELMIEEIPRWRLKDISKFIFECPLCDEKFDFKSKLKRHIRKHTGEKPFKCDQCDKRFFENTQLRLHSRTHTGERPHVCRYCGKDYARIWSLNEHMLTHQEKPHTCTECNKSFVRSGELKKHFRLLHKPKTHDCDICGKSFDGPSWLKQHMKKHTNERPYDCNMCEKKFKLKCHLKNHVDRIHTIKGDMKKKARVSKNKGKKLGPRAKKVKPDQSTKVKEVKIEKDDNFNEDDVPLQDLRNQVTSGNKDSIKTNEDKLLECSVCTKKFKSKQFLLNHIDKIHNKKRKFDTMEGVASKFENVDIKLEKNIKLEIDQQENENNLMDVKVNIGEIKGINEVFTETFLYDCSLCEKKYKTEGFLNMHVKRIHSNVNMMDDNGSMSNVNLKQAEFTNIKVEIKQEHAKENNVTVDEIKHHTSITQNNESWDIDKNLTLACSQCEKKFKSRQFLNNHINRIHCPTLNASTTENLNEVLNSEKCIYVSIKAEGENNQIDVVHNTGEMEHEKSNDNFSTIVHQDSTKFLYECPVCTDKFQFKNHLSSHIRRKHSKKKDINTLVESVNIDLEENVDNRLDGVNTGEIEG